MDQWNVLTEILCVLRVPYEATNAIQKSSYTLSDFFACWLKIEYKLDGLMKNGDLVTDFAQILSEKLFERKSNLFNYPTMMSAIYLDPRVRGEIDDNQIMIAKYKLEELHNHVQEIKKQQNKNSESDVQIEDTTAKKSSDDSFELHLAKRASRKCTNNQPSSADCTMEATPDFFQILDEFEKTTPYKSIPVLKYWESQKETRPELYELACIINSIPPSQASVERSFSILKFIFTCKRHRLKAKMLNNILMIKLNQTMIADINEQDLQALD